MRNTLQSHSIETRLYIKNIWATLRDFPHKDKVDQKSDKLRFHSGRSSSTSHRMTAYFFPDLKSL